MNVIARVRTRVLRFCSPSLYPLHHENSLLILFNISFIITYTDFSHIHICLHKLLHIYTLVNPLCMKIHFHKVFLHGSCFVCPSYDNKSHLLVRLRDFVSKNIPSLPLLPDQLWPRSILTLLRSQSMSQIDQFENYFYSIVPYKKTKDYTKI